MKKLVSLALVFLPALSLVLTACGGSSEGGDGIAINEFTKAVVSQDTLDYVEEVEEQVINGEIEVDTAVGRDQEWIENRRNSVKP